MENNILTRIHTHPVVLKLREIAQPLLKDMAGAYWVEVDGEDDDGTHRCYECALKKRDELIAKHDEDSVYLSGGSVPEVESMQYCEDCETPLSVSLTHYGVQGVFEKLLDSGELDHRDAINQYAALELYEAFRGYYPSDDAKKIGLIDEYIEDCLLKVSAILAGVTLKNDGRKKLRI